jgi:RimJ/RimL family protein N-acetyltransferase
MGAVVLRASVVGDGHIFFNYHSDPDALAMAGSEPQTRSGWDTSWSRLVANEAIRAQTILVSDVAAGYVAAFNRREHREVCYWLGRQFWNRGIASHALSMFLRLEQHRPLWAVVAEHNHASIRVLQKCGFVYRDRQPTGPERADLLMSLD